ELDRLAVEPQRQVALGACGFTLALERRVDRRLPLLDVDVEGDLRDEEGRGLVILQADGLRWCVAHPGTSGRLAPEEGGNRLGRTLAPSLLLGLLDGCRRRRRLVRLAEIHAPGVAGSTCLRRSRDAR